MKRQTILVLTIGVIAAALMACERQAAPSAPLSGADSPTAAASVVDYPDTRRDDVVDSYFGVAIADPYRWLEDDRSEETAAWVQVQNRLSFAYLESLPSRDAMRERVGRLINYPRESAPFRAGEYHYFYRNTGLQNQDIIYRQRGDGEIELFIDPNTLSEDGTVALSRLEFSPDGSLAAYQLSEGGADWRSVEVIDTRTRDVLERLENLKFSGLAWRGNEGFYYSSYPRPDGSRLSARTDDHILYFHRLGTPQSEDERIFGGTPEEKHRYVFGSVSEDQRYLMISAANSTSGNKLFARDLAAPNGALVTLAGDEDAELKPVTTRGDWLYLQTNRDAPRRRLVRVALASPAPAAWEEVIPERDEVLDAVAGAGYVFARYQRDAISAVEQYTLDGDKVREIALPGPGTAGGFAARRDDELVYFSFTNYHTPRSLYRLDPESGGVELYRASEAQFDSAAYESRQLFFTSRDGTRVPMIVTHRRGMELDGKRPTLLYGYGGFNVSVNPRYSTFAAAWLEAGGVYAVPNIRGGGEYGKAWHDAGTRQQKHNVFDDFIAAAEFLFAEGITAPDYLVLRGGSNGGLLVGAVMTQRPDLMAVALPAVGVLDMLRYHRFTAGAGWAYDYGTADDSEAMFRYLFGYSPLHNIKDGVDYPATLVTTGDHDDRVVPAHSFKFAASLQHAQAGSAPILIRIETDAGHGAGKPTSKIIDESADVLAFAWDHLGGGLSPQSLPEGRN